ncbi:MAG: hypothetical protein ACK4GN_18230, partial [Runella sp.]
MTVTVLDYTRKLLYEQDCVVLPELGGFLTYFSHAFYSEQYALYHAPQKRVAFNEALKLDDGLLAHYMMINEQISREEAQQRVRQFVQKAKEQIQNEGSCLFEGIGTLMLNEEKKLQFEPLPLANFYAEGYGFKSVSVSTVEPSVSISTSESAADWTQYDRPAEDTPFVLPRRRRSRVALYVGGALIIGSALIAGLTQLPSETLKSSLNPFELVSTVQSWFMPVQKSNDVIVEVPVVAKAKEEVVENKGVEPLKVIEEGRGESKPVQPIKEEAMPKATIYSSDEKRDYLVIAGGFAKLSNAERLVKTLKNRGYVDAYILNPEPAEGKL